MNKMIRFLSITVVLATAVVAAQAQVYVEGAYSAMTYKDGGVSMKPAAFSGVLGYEITPNLAAEGLLSVGVKDDSITEQGYKVNVGLSNAMGVFLKPKVMLSNELEVFGRVGYAQTKLKYSEAGSSASAKDGGSALAYGLGANYYLDKKTYVTASYINLYDKNKIKVNGFNIGVGYKF